MFEAVRSRMMRGHHYILMGLLTVFLTGCQDIQDSFYDTAINFERSRAGLEVTSVRADDIEFYLLQGGHPEGETILMVHGFGSDKNNWLRLAGKLNDNYRIIAVDQAGHGESSQYKGTQGEDLDYLISSQARRLKSLLDVLNIDKVHYMGNSMGGAVGLQFAVSYPERLTSLVLLDNAGIDSPKESEYFQLLKKGENPLIMRKPGDVEGFLEFVMSDSPFIPWPIPNVLERRAIARQDLNERIFVDMVTSKEEMGSAENVNMMLKSIHTPSLVIWGEEDRVLDVSSVEVMKAHMPDLKVVILTGVGHVPMVEAPAEVAQAFLEFTSRLSSK